MKRTIPTTERDLLNTLAEFFDEMDREYPENPDEVLKEAGIDQKQLVSKILPVIQKELKSSPYNWRNKTSELKEVKNKLFDFHSMLDISRNDLITKLKELIKIGGEEAYQFTLAYRNFDNMSDDDLKNLINELSYLNKKNQPKKNDNSIT